MSVTPDDIIEESAETLGAIFRKARHAQQYSVEDAAESTRIHARLIRDLEEDNYKKMPAEFFVRGFIKLYSGFLGIDPDKAIGVYVQQVNADPKGPASTTYRQNILMSENYADPTGYRKSKKILSLIMITMALLVILVFIIILLPGISERMTRVEQTNHITAQKKPGVVDPDTVKGPSAQPDDSEIIVDRPPPITIDEISDPGPSSDKQSSKTVENARILDQKMYETTKQSGSPEIVPKPASPVAPEMTNISESPTPEPMGVIPSTADQKTISGILTESTASEDEQERIKSGVTGAETREKTPLKIDTSEITQPSGGQKLIPDTIVEAPPTEPAVHTTSVPAQPVIIDEVLPDPPVTIATPSNASFAKTPESGTPVVLPEKSRGEKEEEKKVPTYTHFQPVTVTVTTTKTQPKTDTEPITGTPPQDSQPKTEDTP